MLYLVLVSLLWALSFGLIKGRLVSLDPYFVAAVRLGFSAAVFLPLLRPKGLGRGRGLLLAGIGAVQFGLMYVLYTWAFRDLKAYEVALFTIFTPLYVTLLHDALARRFHAVALGTALLAILGTGICQAHALGRAGLLRGFLLVQLSNLCFALGQIAYRRAMVAVERPDARLFALPCLGGFLVALAGACAFGVPAAMHPSPAQWLVLAYLGAVASGLGFFLWNLGARRTRPGALAILNDLKIPLSIACSMLLFGERGPVHPLLLGGALLLFSLALHQRWAARETA